MATRSNSFAALAASLSDSSGASSCSDDDSAAEVEEDIDGVRAQGDASAKQAESSDLHDAHCARTSSAEATRGGDITCRAVSVEWLVNFANVYACWEWTTKEVVEKIIKPKTEHPKHCRFIELQGEGLDMPGAVGPVDTFLSHCWGNHFGDLVAAAQHNSRPGRRFWIDIFAVNQHMDSKEGPLFQVVRRSLRRTQSSGSKAMLEFEDDLQQLNSVVRAAAEGTTLVLCPRKAIDDESRNPIKRVWCVEEIRETLNAGLPLLIKSGAQHETAPGRYIWREETDKGWTNQLVESVAVQSAQATKAEDRELIMRKLEAAGFDHVNGQIQQALWVAFTSRMVPAWDYVVQGQTALRKAIQQGILPPDALNKQNPEGWTPLHCAANAGYARRAATLIAMGAVVDARNNQYRTPAFQAAWQGHLECVKLLAEAGADLNAADKYGESLAHRARVGPSKGSKGNRKKQVAARAGVTRGHREVAEWVRSQGGISSCCRQCIHCDRRALKPAVASTKPSTTCSDVANLADE